MEPTIISLLQISALLVSTAGTSLSLTISDIIVPGLLLAPSTLLLRQWKNLYDKVAFFLIFVMAYSGISNSILAWYFHHAAKETLGIKKWQVYAVAAVFSFAMNPYTMLVMWKSSYLKLLVRCRELEEREKNNGRDKEVSREVSRAGWEKGPTDHELLVYWSNLNYGRASLVTIATLLGFWATTGMQ
jgi:hypothetical protein